jgi:hypothetical protein
MNRASVLALSLVAFVLCACQGNERASVTGSYGTGVVTGVVVMTEGSSPAGVEVSVRATGMSARLTADGQFTFAGVPEQADLVFQRPADGIHATLRLETANGPIVVELAQATAKKSGRRRAVASRTFQFEGLVQSATETQLVIETKQQQNLTIVLTAGTIIRHGGKDLTPADLVAGTRVQVKASLVNDVFTAVEVIVQKRADDDDEEEADKPTVGQYEGTVVRASASELTIFSSKKKEVTCVLNAETVIRKGKTSVLATDIQPGWRVHVKAAPSVEGTTQVARQVTVQKMK